MIQLPSSLRNFRRESEKIDCQTFWQAEKVGKGELWNDSKGTFRRTKATVVFPVSQKFVPFDPNEDSYADVAAEIFQVAVAILNRVVSVYRYITGDAYLPLLNADDINNKFWLGKCIVENGQISSGIGRESGFEHRLTNTIPDYASSYQDQIRLWLVEQRQFPLYESFLQSARLRLKHGEWSVAIIEAQTGFEMFVSSTIRDYYLNSGRSPADVERICRAGLQNLVKDHLPKAVHKEFSSGVAEYNAWSENTYRLRNAVVHNGQEATRTDSFEAVLAVEHAIEYLVNRPGTKYWPKEKPVTQVNEFLS